MKILSRICILIYNNWFILNYSQSGPLFVKEMPSLTLVAEKTALVPCMYGGYPVDKIHWQKNSKVITTGVGSGKEKETHFIALSNGTLKIDKINTESDKGQYTCYISNRKGESASGTVDVNVMRESESSFLFCIGYLPILLSTLYFVHESSPV